MSIYNKHNSTMTAEQRIDTENKILHPHVLEIGEAMNFIGKVEGCMKHLKVGILFLINILKVTKVKPQITRLSWFLCQEL